MNPQPTEETSELAEMAAWHAGANGSNGSNGSVESHAGGDILQLVEAAQESTGAGNSGTGPGWGKGGSDFVRFYGLRENPFGDSVNPAYLYRTESHVEAFNRMMLAIEHDISTAMITGPSGMGKTLITQVLLQHLDAARFEPVLLLVSPGLSKTGLLREILAELSVAMPEGASRTHELLRVLSNYIIDLHAQGKRLVLIVDECHLLSSDCLHLIRTISNFETPERKLTTCLLIGEARFASRLEHPSYASLRNRMYLRSELKPMTAAECEQYIKFRLMIAGRMNELFDPKALEALHAHSGGVCRNINKLCMLSMLEGAMRGEEKVGEGAVQAVMKYEG